ncbi:MAG: tRNA lysidine(34) synthetase TilS [Candidatus Saccharimonadales bacterium]
MSEQHISVPAGTYIVAVSGGVDSVVLLDLLSKLPNVHLIVAHFDHGIRKDSQDDALFVQGLAEQYQLPFESERHELGPDASEAEARKHRYNFLRKIAQKYGADSLITAHHQDDVIETSIINIIRGTGRSGLTSLASTNERMRPLLHIPKSELITYAQEHNLEWREDSTNIDPKYLRNTVRHTIVSRMTAEQRNAWLAILQSIHTTNQKLDSEIQGLLRRGLHKGTLVLSRNWFISLPHAIAKEVMRALLFRAGAKEVDRKTIERVTVQIKTLPAGKVIHASGITVQLTKRSARFQSRSSQDIK